MGVTTLPLDLDIFLRSGSRIQPDSTAVCQGSTPFSKLARTIEENNQVRMISCPCGRRSIGKTRLNRSSSVCQPLTICGVSDEVAQVSITSGSAAKPPGTLRCDSSKPGGHSEEGSTGSDSLSGMRSWV